MAYFLNLFGGQANGGRDVDNAAEVVENLVERIETSTVLEDRRDALKALRSLAKKVRLPVAAIGMNAYMEILEKENTNAEILSITLEILVAVLNDDEAPVDSQDEIGERLAEMIVRKKSFISSVLGLVESYEFAVRRALIQLLTALLRHRASEVQTAIVEEPMGVSRLVDLLHDTREIIRNSAVLMMSELSRAHPQIQQLLAYENAFQFLFDIIDLEPVESIVIEDCLYVILNLLRKNSNNQQLFREASLIQRLALLLNVFVHGRNLSDDARQIDNEWPKQKVANMIFLLQVIRSLVSPQENSQSNTRLAQKVIANTGMLKNLCSVFLSEKNGASVEVITEVIITIAEVICGNYPNQEYFSAQNHPRDFGNRPALILLLLAMNSDEQPFKLRCAVFYCFLCFLYDNEIGKTKVIDPLLPSSIANSAKEITAAQCICYAILSSEAVQVWMGCVCMMHCLLDTEDLKQQLLRVQLATDPSEEPSSFIRHISKILYYVFISINVPDGYGAEGSEDENQVVRGLIAFLLSVCLQYGNDTEKTTSLNVVVERRVGKEKLIEYLDAMSRSEHYVRAAQRPQPLAKVPHDLLLDYHFVKLFKEAEGFIMKKTRSSVDSMSGVGSASDSVVNSYKELIKRQDETIVMLNQQVKKMKDEMDDLSLEKKEMNSEAKNTEMNGDIDAAAQLQIDSLKNLVMQWQVRAQKYQDWGHQWQNYQISQLPNPQDVVLNQLSSQIKDLEEQLNHGWQMYESQGQSLASAISDATNAKSEVANLKTQLEMLSIQAKSPKSDSNSMNTAGELVAIKKEQEDLLVLLADQDAKILEYRRKLIELGQTVTDDEDNDA